MYCTIASSNSSPATRTLRLNTIPESEMIATSVVPPPISMIMLPAGSCTGSPTPIAAAIGSSIKYTSRAPACVADSRTARFSTSVIPDGTAITTRGFTRTLRLCTLVMKCRNIASVTSKSAITPSLSGRTATIFAGVRPNMRLASSPTASTRLVPACTATTDGSRKTIP